MRQIPRLSWTRIGDLFRSEDRFGGSTHPEAFGFVPDPADRKFAALADAVQAPLVTSDAGLLNAGGQMAVPVLKPSEFAGRCGALYRVSGRPGREATSNAGRRSKVVLGRESGRSFGRTTVGVVWNRGRCSSIHVR